MHHLVYRWRGERAALVAAGSGSSLRLVPVRLVEESRAHEVPPVPLRSTPAPASRVVAKPTSMEIEFPGGVRVRVRVDETVSQAALRRMVAVLRG